MDSVFQELTLGSQRRFNQVRRKVQFFSTFAGGVIEALRELGYRLSNIGKEANYPGLGRPQTPAGTITAASGGNNIELYFEQRDNDQCRVLIVPYRTDLPYLSQRRYTAQLGLELSRYSSDPDVLRQAMNVNTRGQFSRFAGGSRLPKLCLNSPPDIKQPGSMSFELRGARLVVSMNVLAELSKYRLSDFDLDIAAIKRDLEAYFYGLEKYLALLLQNFGTTMKVEEKKTPRPTVEETSSINRADSQTLDLSSVAGEVVDSLTPEQRAMFAPPPEPSSTNRTVNLSELDLPQPQKPTMRLSEFDAPDI